MTLQQLLSPGNLHQWACCRNKQRLCCPTNYKFPNTMWQNARSSNEAILWAASTFLSNGLSSFHLNGVRLVTNHCRLTCHPAKNLIKNHPSLLELKLETTCKVYGTNIGQSLNTKNKKYHLFLISAAIVMKACSTLIAFLALVSKNGMPISSAKACK